MRLLPFIFLLSSVLCSAQSESDTAFYFDYSMNHTSPEKAKWVSLKTPLRDSSFLIETRRQGPTLYEKEVIYDEYTVLYDGKMLILRSFAKYDDQLGDDYIIDVDFVQSEPGLYRLDLYSKELNIHKTVYSKTLVPICPINKTIQYHPNCSVAKIDFHTEGADSIWNSNGELIASLFDEESVDKLPVIEGFEDSKFELGLIQFVQQHMTYPEEALELNIEGRVYVSFIITSTGQIEHIQVMKGMHPLIDNASMDVIKQMKIVTPGIKGDEQVNIRFVFPFNYHIQ